jgi:hypothetical protein
MVIIINIKKLNFFMQVLVLITTILLSSIGVFGLANLRQDFDPTWLLPSQSYLAKFMNASRIFYPSDGYPISIYISNVSHSAHLKDIASLVERVERQDVVHAVDAWYPPFEIYANSHFNASKSFMLFCHLL